jgi:queuine/archaeosine tRNA-ribosyltransferase
MYDLCMNNMTNRADNRNHVGVDHDSRTHNDNNKRRNRKMARIAKKTCTKCGNTFAVTEFYRDKSQKDGRASWCKACEKAYNRSYFASLKKADAPKKAAIANDKNLAKFEAGMKSERVKRGHLNASRDDNARVNAPKKSAPRRRKAKA